MGKTKEGVSPCANLKEKHKTLNIIKHNTQTEGGRESYHASYPRCELGYTAR